MNRRDFLGAAAAPFILPVKLAEKMPALSAEAEAKGTKYLVTGLYRNFKELSIEIDIVEVGPSIPMSGKLTIERKAPGFATVWDLEVGEEIYMWRRFETGSLAARRS